MKNACSGTSEESQKEHAARQIEDHCNEVAEEYNKVLSEMQGKVPKWVAEVASELNRKINSTLRRDDNQAGRPRCET